MTTKLRVGLILVCLVAGAVYAASSVTETKTSSQRFLADVSVWGKQVSVPTVISIPSADGGGGAMYTLGVSSGSAFLSCGDTNGCTVSLSETGAVSGTVVRIVNVSANSCDVSDSSGVMETAAGFTLGQWDAIALMYVADRWVEVSRSDN